MMTRAATSPGPKNRETATGRRAMLESGQSERTRRSSGRRLRVAGGTNLTGTVGSPTSDRSVQKLARHIPPSAQTDGALSTLRARKRSALNVWPGARPRVTGRQRRQHRGSGSPNRRANHALRDQMPARERHRAVSLRHRRQCRRPASGHPRRNARVPLRDGPPRRRRRSSGAASGACSNRSGASRERRRTS